MDNTAKENLQLRIKKVNNEMKEVNSFKTIQEIRQKYPDDVLEPLDCT